MQGQLEHAKQPQGAEHLRVQRKVELLRGYYSALVDLGVDTSQWSWEQYVLDYQLQATFTAAIPYFWAKAAREQIKAGMSEEAKQKTETTLMEVAARCFTFILDSNGPEL